MSTTGGTRLPHFRKALDHDGHDSDPSPRLRNHDRGQRGETFTDTTPSLVAGWFAHDQGTTFFPISPRVQKPCHPLSKTPTRQPATSTSSGPVANKHSADEKKPPRCGARSNLGVGNNVSRLSHPSTPTTVFIMSASRSRHLFLHTPVAFASQPCDMSMSPALRLARNQSPFTRSSTTAYSLQHQLEWTRPSPRRRQGWHRPAYLHTRGTWNATGWSSVRLLSGFHRLLTGCHTCGK